MDWHAPAAGGVHHRPERRQPGGCLDRRRPARRRRDAADRRRGRLFGDGLPRARRLGRGRAVPRPLLQPAGRGPVLRPRDDRQRRRAGRTRTRGAAGDRWRAIADRADHERRPCADRDRSDEDGRIRATLTTVSTWVREPDPGSWRRRWRCSAGGTTELDPALPPAVGFAGAKHLILAARDLARLERLEYPFEPLQALMLEHDLTTIQLVWRESPDRFRARDPFPVGGVVEDPATGAAAAALAPTCGREARSRRRPRSRSSRASRWAGRAG